MIAPTLRRPATRVAGNGGLPARRAVVRWAWRLFRREWRQQILVLALLAVAVAAMTAVTTFGSNASAVSLDGTFGAANHLMTYDGSDPEALAADIAAAEGSFGTIEVIAHRSVPVPGSAETVDLRAQAPRGAFGAPMLALTQGRYPTRTGEIAVTDEVATIFEIAVGDVLALDGRDRTVVGLVENPGDLSDEFALVSPSDDDPPESVTILFDASPAEFASFIDAHGSPPMWLSRQEEESTGVAAALFGLATVVLLFVSLVAAAGFAVIARRRQRQLGMLGAIGATEKHLRLVMVADGAVVGVVAAVIGTAAGLVLWVAAAPALETAVQHRIDRSVIPWGLVGAGILLAVVTATAAAWWPARAVARIPIMLAISGRPPRPRPAHRSALVAGLLIAIGVVCLALARPTATNNTEHPNEFRNAVVAPDPNAPLLITGTLATALGILFISPLAIRALAARGKRWPIGARLAVRDLGRYQARSGAALAAISLSLGIAVTIAIVATAARYGADEGNLSDRQLLVRIGDLGGLADDHVPERTPAELRDLAAKADRLAASLGHPAMIELDMAVDPGVGLETGVESNEGGRPAVALGTDQGIYDPLFVATPELLGHYGLDPDTVDMDTDVLTVQAGHDFEFLVVADKGGGAPQPNVQRIDLPGYTSAPTSLITLDALRRHGFERVPAGWLVEASEPITPAQLAAAREVAADAGMTVEARDDQHSLSDLGLGATLVGIILALGVLAMTVGLIRSEAAGDLRTLTATGASTTVRRTLTGVTSGALALFGAILGTLGAYIAMIAWYRDDIGSLSRVPVVQIAIITIGLPLLAALAGWLLSGREPPAIARRALE
jgi:putative ABC transport system permease protein